MTIKFSKTKICIEEIPELWRTFSKKSIKQFLDTKFKYEDTGKGINSGTEIGDYLATKDGWMLYTLHKRLEANILTQEEYDYGLYCYNYIRKKLSNSIWEKLGNKHIYLIDDNLNLPERNNELCKLTLSQERLKNCIIDLQKTTKGLISYNTISKYYYDKYKINRKEPSIANGIKYLYKIYYYKSNLPNDF